MRHLLLRATPHVAWIWSAVCVAYALADNWWPLKITLGIMLGSVLALMLWIFLTVLIEAIQPSPADDEEVWRPLRCNVVPFRVSGLPRKPPRRAPR